MREEEDEEEKEEVKRATSGSFSDENADFEEREETEGMEEDVYGGGEYMLRDNVIDDLGMAYQQQNRDRREGMEEEEYEEEQQEEEPKNFFID